MARRSGGGGKKVTASKVATTYTPFAGKGMRGRKARGKTRK